MPSARGALRRRMAMTTAEAGEDGDQRVENAELGDDEGERAERLEVLVGQAAELLGQRHPVVAGIPQQHGARDRQRQRGAGPQPRAERAIGGNRGGRR